MNRLTDARERIDEVDRGILDLLAQRGALVEEIGKMKKRQGQAAYDPQREQEVLDRVIKANPGPYPDAAIRRVFEQVISASLRLQDKKDSDHPLAEQKPGQRKTVVRAGGVCIGGKPPIVMAGPCSIESQEQLAEIAAEISCLGAQILRGGAFKPRTSPYSFQGLGKEGLTYLKEVAGEFGMASITEVMDTRDVGLVCDHADILQIGSRNMQNFALLKAVGETDTPVMLKRGFAATIEEWLCAAEYILMGGNGQVILCERGIRTYETATRNTLDISAVPILKQLSHLPVIVDISHAAGRRDIAIPLAKAALAAGADGIMVEVHNNPSAARSDAEQQLNFAEFGELMQALGIAQVRGRAIPARCRAGSGRTSARGGCSSSSVEGPVSSSGGTVAEDQEAFRQVAAGMMGRGDYGYQMQLIEEVQE